MRTFIFFSCLLLFYCPLSADTSSPFEILQPADLSVQKTGFVPLVIKIHDTNITDAYLLSDDNRRFPITSKSDENTYCQTLSLHYGENKIRVRWHEEGRLQEVVHTFYYTTPAYTTFQHIPKRFVDTPFHTSSNEARCSSCHDMSSNEKQGVAFVNVQDSNCYACHKAMTSPAFGHAPAVNWLCSSCHKEQNSTAESTSRFSTPSGISTSCFTCHDGNKEEWDDRRFKHQPLAAGKCNKCHNSHASDQPFFLRKPVQSLCTGCHAMQAALERRSAQCIGSNCTQCHSPHGSDRRFFLKDTYRPVE